MDIPTAREGNSDRARKRRGRERESGRERVGERQEENHLRNICNSCNTKSYSDEYLLESRYRRQEKWQKVKLAVCTYCMRMSWHSLTEQIAA